MRHRYGSHFHQFADLLQPSEGSGPFPVAVVLHGGFWREQHSLDLTDDLARDLARRGWAAWNVEYRRVGDAGGGGGALAPAGGGAAPHPPRGPHAPPRPRRGPAPRHPAGRAPPPPPPRRPPPAPAPR